MKELCYNLTMYKSIKYINEIFIENSELISNVILDEFSEDYEGVTLKIYERKFRSRLAKKTFKKKGYFVAFWEKDEQGINQAYSYKNYPEKLIISILDGERSGQFIFPKSLLLQKKILRDESSKGKMALRVYPSWETDLNKSANSTQVWQSLYFINTSDNIDNIDTEMIKHLYFN